MPNGSTQKFKATPLMRRVLAAYNRKYDSAIPPGEPIYAVEPRVAFGFIEHLEDFPRTATRWNFG